MHLEKIKLAGFKSFVDPTTIELSQSLTGVVGPNGCGKSNVIDAIRWVMGESSARYLRGETLTDVIFNGSSQRQPVSQASIELVFNNEDQQLGGQWRSYREIAIKRQLDREGRSNYYLNGTRCRRRDIVDIFLGTGLGPRSYAIIEQGMISRIIEAKPMELRHYLEEVSGLTKYKERRRETENRIQHTQDNLSRVNDRLVELNSYLEQLNKQAQIAHQYRELKQRQRWLEGQQRAWQWQHHQNQCQILQAQITDLEQTYQDLQSQYNHIQSQMDKVHVDLNESQEQYQTTYQACYRLQVDIKHWEDAIKRLKDEQQHCQKKYARLIDNKQKASQEKQQQKEYYQEVEAKLQAIKPRLQNLQAQLDEEREAYQTSRQQWQTYYEAYNKLNEQLTEKRRHEQSLQHQIDLNTQQYEQAQKRLKAIDLQLEQINTANLSQQRAELDNQLQQKLNKYQTLQDELHECQKRVESRQQEVDQLTQQLNAYQSQVSQLQGQVSSLQTLLQDTGEDDDKQNWFQQYGLDQYARLLEVLEVTPGWEAMVERVLAAFVNAKVIDSEQVCSDILQSSPPGQISLVIDQKSSLSFNNAELPLAKLSDYVTSSHAVAVDYLQAVWIANSQTEAWQYRHQLYPYESIMTASGLWMGRNWLQFKKDHLGDKYSMLQKQQQLNLKQSELCSYQQQYQQAKRQYEQLQIALKQARSDSQQAEQRLQDHYSVIMETRSELKVLDSRVEQQRHQYQQLQDEKSRWQQQLQQAQSDEQEAQQQLNELKPTVQYLEDDKQQAYQSQMQLNDYLQTTQDKLDKTQTNHQQALLEEQRLSSELDKINDKINQQQTAIDHYQNQLDELNEGWPDNKQLQQYESQLQDYLEEKSKLDEQCQQLQQTINYYQNQQNELKHEARNIEKQLKQQLDELQTIRMQYQEQQTRQNTLYEQLCTYYDETMLQKLVDSLQEVTSQNAIDKPLRQVTQQIKQLGAVNLAAIDEYQQQYQRYNELQQQYHDIAESLQMLQDAIETIDQETRQRFKTTFEQVDAAFQTLFPKMFEGGKACLSPTEDNWLTTGVTIQARPPGKRNTTIHMLSGGEKALTALALVFALFQMNPAPFCFLDEVDAPLDDANVARFCQLVRQMNEKVQFLFVTHNKMTMEMAQQLIGVTMKEPGVSRVVSVNVDNALQWAQ